jgi:hypothetical protein
VYDFGLSIVVCHEIGWRPLRVPFPNVWQWLVVFLIPDVFLFGRWMKIICTDFFGVCLLKGWQRRIAHPETADPHIS